MAIQRGRTYQLYGHCPGQHHGHALPARARRDGRHHRKWETRRRSRRREPQRHSGRKGRDRTAIGHLPIRHGKGKSRPCGRKYVPKLRIHPNPFCDRLHLSCGEDIRYASVTACNGQILYRQNRGGNIDTSAWASGIYVVRVDTPEHSYIEKVVKK
ncbi:T9SS type A sorting domain-containing protein [Paraprevotella clara]